MRKQLIWLGMTLTAGAPAFAGPISTVNLGTASAFTMLGGTISNTGTSVVIGNVGATTSITGIGAGGPGTATGTVTLAGSTVAQAYADFVSAFNTANSNLTTPSTASFADLTVDRTFLGNNVYTFSATDIVSTASITLTFDANNDGTEVFIIRISRDLTINGPITFHLQNGAQAANIFWIVGRTETISPTALPVTWDGTILAGTSFTMSAQSGGSGVLAGTINGCVYTETANTLAGKTNINGCGSSAATVPEPGTAGLVGIGGLLGLLAWRKRCALPRQS